MDEEDEDVRRPIDDVGDEIDSESDADFDVEDREHDELDLSLNPSDDSEIRFNPSLVPKLSLLGRVNANRLIFLTFHDLTDILCYISCESAPISLFFWCLNYICRPIFFSC